MSDTAGPLFSIHSPNYYLLKKHVSYTTLKGYSQTLVNVMINKNHAGNANKYLFVKHYKGFWSLSRRTLKDDIHRDIFEGFVEMIGDELGFRGMDSDYADAKFYPLAYLFDVATQNFDPVRVRSEKTKNRNQVGKTYHLLFVEYTGKDELPFENRKDQTTIVNYKWVDFNEGVALLESNLELPGIDLSISTGKFHLEFFKQIHNLYKETVGNRDTKIRTF